MTKEVQKQSLFTLSLKSPLREGIGKNGIKTIFNHPLCNKAAFLQSFRTRLQTI